MIGVDAIGNCRQQDDSAARSIRPLARSTADLLHLEIVGAIRKARFVGRGAPKRKTPPPPFRQPNKGVIQSLQTPLTHPPPRRKNPKKIQSTKSKPPARKTAMSPKHNSR